MHSLYNFHVGISFVIVIAAEHCYLHVSNHLSTRCHWHIIFSIDSAIFVAILL